MSEINEVDNVLVPDTRIVSIGVNFLNYKYGKATLGVVDNPFTGKREVAIKPYFTNKYGNQVPLYTFEDDIRYEYYNFLVGEYQIACKPIPEKIDTFIKEMDTRKKYAEKQADNKVFEKTMQVMSGEASDFVFSTPEEKAEFIEHGKIPDTQFATSGWRDAVVNSEVFKECSKRMINESLKVHPIPNNNK